MNNAGQYIGRFAPSPTGPLHFGSLVAALGSALAARHAGGRWLLRIDDIDPPREVSGAADAILRSLERLGFHWDGPVVYQSRRHDAYCAALESLVLQGLAYPCACSRSQIAAEARRRGTSQRRYPGTCRSRLTTGSGALAVRVLVPNADLTMVDLLQGTVVENLQDNCGDFVVWRRDGLPAYQLAATVDDAAAGISEIVRGADLLESSLRQNLLRQHLGFVQPSMVHLPIATDARGEKLGKSTGAPPVDTWQPGGALCAALSFLGQAPPADLEAESVAEIWRWATLNWAPNRLIGKRKLAVENDGRMSNCKAASRPGKLT